MEITKKARRGDCKTRNAIGLGNVTLTVLHAFN